MSSVDFDFHAKDQLMAVRVAVVTGNSSECNGARDDTIATVRNG